MSRYTTDAYLVTIQSLRREGGSYIRSLREARGLSQRDLAALIDVDHYTFISQIEIGRSRIPPDRYRIWADSLGVDTKTFVRTLMQYYDPITYNILFVHRN